MRRGSERVKPMPGRFGTRQAASFQVLESKILEAFAKISAHLVPLLIKGRGGSGKLFDLQRGNARAGLGLDLLDGFRFADLAFERAMGRDERSLAVRDARLRERQKQVGESAGAIKLRQSGAMSQDVRMATR